MILHAGLIARRMNGQWLGVLIEGPSGSGKSDLALRALGAGFRLVADDRVVVFLSSDRLYGRAPGPLAGLIEARGVGVMVRDNLTLARIVARVTCVDTPDQVERLPSAAQSRILGVDLAVLSIWPFETSAPAKLAATLEHLGARAQQGYQARFATPARRDGV
jgi:serine kinase of HPr protein (carbohydrate metabolism regulator)